MDMFVSNYLTQYAFLQELIPSEISSSQYTKNLGICGELAEGRGEEWWWAWESWWVEDGS